MYSPNYPKSLPALIHVAEVDPESSNYLSTSAKQNVLYYTFTLSKATYKNHLHSLYGAYQCSNILIICCYCSAITIAVVSCVVSLSLSHNNQHFIYAIGKLDCQLIISVVDTPSLLAVD